MVKTRQWILANKPEKSIILDGNDATFKLEEVNLPELKENELLVKLLSLSNDPAQRTWISPHIKAERQYTTPVAQGAVMNARGLAEVLESKSPRFKKGQHVLASTGWSELAVVPASTTQPAPDLPGNRPKTLYLGSLGLTGLTAYFGLTEIGQVKPHDTVVISGAAGATGNMAVQLAKKVMGCKRVIGIAGSEEKCKWVESLGADLCLNYKLDSFYADLKKALPGPDGFADVYFDNVGGDMLDAMFGLMARNGRVIACGAISTYNDDPSRTAGLKNWFNVVSMRLTCRGFIVLDYADKYGKARELFQQAVADGRLKVDGSEVVIKASFEEIPKTWTKLFEGSNTGKLVTQLKEGRGDSQL